jgi:hypothetical protein
MTVDIPVGEDRAPTFYHRHGEVFGWACVGLALITLLRKFSARRKQ